MEASSDDGFLSAVVASEPAAAFGYSFFSSAFFGVVADGLLPSSDAGFSSFFLPSSAFLGALAAASAPAAGFSSFFSASSPAFFLVSDAGSDSSSVN